jgi:hypothetical protein
VYDTDVKWLIDLGRMSCRAMERELAFKKFRNRKEKYNEEIGGTVCGTPGS